ncbi:MAG: MmcQ/YjbR family DNA-binding protein, partial [Phycisphaerales bacterium]|nr:MmcQ/YjbR family DNA-binding protein [Phycisphaerales bacterium]
MTIAEFRRIALSMPQATENAHMGLPDFRVKGKIFATLFSRDGDDWGMVKLKPDQQRRFVEANPGVFEPIKGGWGLRGATQVRLAAVNKKTLRDAMFTARLIAPVLEAVIDQRIEAKREQTAGGLLVVKEIQARLDP